MLPTRKTFCLLLLLILFYGSSLQIGILVRQAQTFWEEGEREAQRKRACAGFVGDQGVEAGRGGQEVKSLFYLRPPPSQLRGKCRSLPFLSVADGRSSAFKELLTKDKYQYVLPSTIGTHYGTKGKVFTYIDLALSPLPEKNCFVVARPAHLRSSVV